MIGLPGLVVSAAYRAFALAQILSALPRDPQHPASTMGGATEPVNGSNGNQEPQAQVVMPDGRTCELPVLQVRAPRGAALRPVTRRAPGPQGATPPRHRPYCNAAPPGAH